MLRRPSSSHFRRCTSVHFPSFPVLDKYLREVDRWDPAENAGMGIGL